MAAIGNVTLASLVRHIGPHQGPTAPSASVVKVTTARFRRAILPALTREWQMRIYLRRREFIAGLGGAAAWPLAARTQQRDRVRRIGMLMPYDENDPVAKTVVSAFIQALADLGWTDGRNVRMDLRWAGGDIIRIRALAQELVGCNSASGSALYLRTGRARR